VVGVTQRMDSHDVGSTISVEELQRHLAKSDKLLTTHRVERWVRHGLEFPQYAEAFAANAITALDFPALVADHGAALREDLRVTSGRSLHSFPFPLNLSLLCPFPLNLSSLCPPCVPK